MTTKHTPGPWGIEQFGSDRMAEVRVDGRLACLLHSFHKIATEEDSANLRLIAAAPDLLESLRGLYAAMACYESTPEETLALEYARAAIAKATGGTA